MILISQLGCTPLQLPWLEWSKQLPLGIYNLATFSFAVDTTYSASVTATLLCNVNTVR